MTVHAGAVVFTLASLLAAVGCAGRTPPTLNRTSADTVLTIADPRITESSGLAASVVHPGVYYTHNDRGAAPEVFAVNEDGAVDAVLTLPGAPSDDWEDIAVTPSGEVWVGDIGSGGADTRASVSVIRFREPRRLADINVDWVAYRLLYGDGGHDAEALVVHPRSSRLHIVTKQVRGGGIYAAPRQLSDGDNALEYVAAAPPNITAGSFAPDGSAFALRNYRAVFVYEGLHDPRPHEVALPDSEQGESLVMLGRQEILVGSEGVNSEVVRVRLAHDP